MEYTIDELRHKIFQKVYDVYEIFQNFFGEQYVDLQGIPDDESVVDAIYASTDIGNIESAFPIEVSDEDFIAITARFSRLYPIILIWWPRVTVTNENDRSIKIQDLYAMVKVAINGTIPYEFRGFQLIRTTFPEVQYNSGYVHSHVPHFYGTPSWENPCLGSGPINHTIADLRNDYEETLWMLFCQELSLYVTVESLRGGPYIRMETVGSGSEYMEYAGYNFYSIDERTLGRYCGYIDAELASFKKKIKKFILYYLKNGHLCFNFKNNSFTSGLPYFDYIIDVSNAFIEFFNKEGTEEERNRLYNREFLKKVFISDGKFRRNERSYAADYTENEGREILTFKGEVKTLHIERDSESPVEESIIIAHEVAMFVLASILRIINYRYRNEYRKSIGGEETTSPTYKTVLYL